jgi:hypothetical protein
MTETNAYRKIGRRMAQMKSNTAAFVNAVTMAILAIATDWTAGLITHPLHTKGARRRGLSALLLTVYSVHYELLSN